MDDKKEHNKLDERFHDALAELEISPSPDAWEQLERALDEEDSKRPGAWWLTGLGLLLLVGAALWFFWPADQVHLSPATKHISKQTADSMAARSSGLRVVKGREELSAREQSSRKPERATPADSSQTDRHAREVKSLAHVTGIKVPKTEETLMPVVTAMKNQDPKSSRAEPKVKAGEAIQTDSEWTGLSGRPVTKPTAAVVNSREGPIQRTQARVEPGESAPTDLSPTKTAVPIVTDKPVQKDSVVAGVSKPLADSTKQIANQDSLLKKQVNDTITKLLSAVPGPPPSSVNPWLFSLSGFGAPELYRNQIKAYHGSFDVKNEKTNPRLGAGVRFGVCYKDKLEVSLGCAYSQINQEFHPETLYFPKNISKPYVFNSSLGDMVVPVSTMVSSFNMLAPVPNFKCQYQYSQTVQFLNIPLNVRLDIGKGRMKGYVSAGFNIQYAISELATLELLKENETDRVDYHSLDVRKLNYAVMVGAGGEFRIVKHLSLFLEPTARMNLLPVTNSTTVQSAASFLGVGGGIKWNL